MTTSIYILLDRSGSMASRWAPTLKTINDYVGGLAKDAPDSEVVLLAFDSNYSAVPTYGGGRRVMADLGIGRPEHRKPPTMVVTDIIRPRMRVTGWLPLRTTDCEPRGGTPLYDAIGEAVSLIRDDHNSRGVLVIMTDGEENSSQTVTQHGAKEMLDGVRARGWQVIQLGVEWDAYQQAAGYGTMHSQTVNTSARAMASGETASVLRRHTASYAASGQSMSFSAAEQTALSAGIGVAVGMAMAGAIAGDLSTEHPPGSARPSDGFSTGGDDSSPAPSSGDSCWPSDSGSSSFSSDSGSFGGSDD